MYMYTELCEMALRQTQPDFTFHFIRPWKKMCACKSVHFRYFDPKIPFFLGSPVASLTDIASARTRAHVDVAHETYASRASHVMQCSWHPW